MLNPPAGLSEAELRAGLAGWGRPVAELEYVPVGFGTHHWTAVDPSGGRWFVNVDDLAGRKLRADEPSSEPLHRLRSALSVPRALCDLGYEFPVAPEPDRDGRVVRTLGADGGYALSVYPHVSGQSFSWAADGWSSAQVVPEHLTAVLDILAALHCAPPEARAEARTDDFEIPVRDVLEQAMAGPAEAPGAPGPEHGPFARPAGQLVAEHADLLGRRLARYDELAAHGRSQAARFVLTHGEPHPGNTMRGPDGYLLIDWDTVAVAPPERDLWSFTAEMVERYTARSGIEVDPALLDLYRLRWDLTDIALYVAQFHAAHSDSPNEAASWANLVGTVGNLAATHR